MAHCFQITQGNDSPNASGYLPLLLNMLETKEMQPFLS